MRLGPLGRVAAVVLLAACSDTSNLPVLDPTTPEFSFAVIGCNRVDAADTTGNLSTANVEQLKRTFAEIAAMKPAPKYLFFAGDLVFGYTNDTTQLANELNGWVALYKASPLATSGIELVALPGNHEVQNLSKVATAAGERTWLRIMKPYLAHAGNGPLAGGADNLTTRQDSLSYSFNYIDTHFVTLNTDPVGNDWHVPYKWAATDVAAAKAAGKKHIFFIGHKPAFPYVTVPTDGLAKFTAARDSFWTVVTANKSEGMFSAHNHVYYRSQPAGGTAWQVIAGNGGSKLEATADTTIKNTGTYYGYTVTTVTVGGRVYTKSYGRTLPTTGYTASDAANPTTVRDSVELTQN